MRAAATLLALVPMVLACRRASPSAPRGAATVAASGLCVTEGSSVTVGDRLLVESPKFRAVAATATDPLAELRFTYAGPTAETAALGSGSVRRQIGLKLRAQDACNLVYVMWRIEPASEIVVQTKRNPGQRTSVECENRGYRRVRPLRSTGVGNVAIGSTHVLRAEMRGVDLSVWADGALVWEGNASDAADLDGPVGLRSDNGRFFLQLTAGLPASPRGCPEAKDE